TLSIVFNNNELIHQQTEICITALIRKFNIHLFLVIEINKTNEGITLWSCFCLFSLLGVSNKRIEIWAQNRIINPRWNNTEDNIILIRFFLKNNKCPHNINGMIFIVIGNNIDQRFQFPFNF